MAAAVPSDDDIRNVTDFCSISQPQAVVLLKKYNTVEQAVARYWEDPVGSLKEEAPQIQQPSWEPADNLPTFRIDADDTTSIPPGPSRPPSRVDHHGNIDAAAGVGEQFGPSDEESELQKAIEMSKQEMPAQETGITPAGQQFGPANKTHYEPNQWALTATTTSRELVDHPSPSQRQRLPGEPAFLRGSSETGYLAPLLNIYHSIPLAREAFLSSSIRLHNYKYDSAWWKGESDADNKAMAVSGSTDAAFQNFLVEMQTLMTFLDGTKRAYGSVDGLAGLHAFKTFGAESQLSRLLEVWKTAAIEQDPGSPFSQIFTSEATKDPHQAGYGLESKELVCLESPVDIRSGWTLMEVLDVTIWHDTLNDIDDVWMKHCAEIFTMRLHDPGRSNVGLGLEIPSEWFPDRYTYDYREPARRMREELVQLKREVNQCTFVQRRCEVATGPGNRRLKIREILQAASRFALDGATPTTGQSELTDVTMQTSPADDPEESRILAAQLQTILERIDEKILTLEKRKTELKNMLRETALQLTRPADILDTPSKMKYILQGVSTKPSITYIRQIAPPPDLISLEDSEDESKDLQWWRMSYDLEENTSEPMIGPQPQSHLNDKHNTSSSRHATSDQRPFSIRKVSEAQVLEAAKIEHDSVVLVYARESAFEPRTRVDAGAILRKFVEQDNTAFDQELNEERGTARGSLAYNAESAMTVDGMLLETDQNVSYSGYGGKSVSSMSGISEKSYNEDPPPYEATIDDPRPQMEEMKSNKIGMLADKMLERSIDEESVPVDDSGPLHIEHASKPLR